MELQPRGRKGALRGTIRQRRLLTSFIELMNEGSAFSDVKIEDIAKRAGITRAAFYYFFESKEQLLLAELDGFVQQLIEAASSFFTGAGDDIRRELHDALVAVARQRRELQGLSRAFSEA